MQVRWTIISACALAVLAAQARADHHESKSSTASGQASEPAAGGPGSSAGKAEDTGTRAGAPGMLPGEAESDRPGRAEGAQQTVVGTIQKVEKDALTVQSTPLSDPHELTLGEDTKFLREDGSSLSREQLNEGDMVRATYVGEGASGRAVEIRVIQEQRQEQQGSGG